MRAGVVAAVLLSASLLTPALAQGEESAAPEQQQAEHRLTKEDRAFLDFASEDSQAQIQLGMLAEKRAQSEALRAFARLLVTDNAAIASRLAALVNGGRIEVPDGIGKQGQATLAKLSALSGTEFDRAFIRLQVEDHIRNLARFTEQRNTTQNPDIRRFAAGTLPILQQHLKLAEAVRDSLPPAASAGSLPDGTTGAGVR